jgi:glycosyltransferase involved in cell wall biosynthesis
MTPSHESGSAATPMPTGADLAIIVPVYRNADTVAELAHRVDVTLSGEGWNYRLVFVVDASPDQSWSVVESLAAADSRIAGILLARNVGQHAALQVGVRLVHARRLVIMDADLQDPPELLPQMLRRAESSGHTVFARREGRYQSWGRMVTSRLFKTLLGGVVGLPANVGTYFVIGADVAESIRRCRVRHPQLVVMARRFSSGWEAVHYTRSRAPAGRSSYSRLGRLRSAYRALRCAWTCRAAAGGMAEMPSDLPAAKVVNLW